MVTAPDLDQVCRVTVVAPDRLGLLATVAGVLTMHRLDVRGASAETVDGAAVQVWRTVSAFGPPPADDVLRRDITKALEGAIDVSARLARRAQERPRPAIRVAAPRVELVPEASDSATVLQVRAHDEPGLLHRVASLVAEHGVGVRSALVDTLGAEAVDVFYLEGGEGGPLEEDVAQSLRDVVAEALGARS
jgi:[protein-PII] uridylyltransferase